MKKLRSLLPVLVLLLVVAYLVLPAQNDTLMPVQAVSVQEQNATQNPANTVSNPAESAEDVQTQTETLLPEDGSYTTKEDVALYLVQYGHLPSNFVTKAEAEKAGWSGGSLEKVLPGMCIGGDRFGNREKLLPSAKGRTWTECDINTLGKNSRGAERLVFSNDGLIYYTDDHYSSFTQLY